MKFRSFVYAFQRNFLPFDALSRYFGAVHARMRVAAICQRVRHIGVVKVRK